MKRKLVIATRASALALWQANYVAQALETAWPGLEVELKKVKTTGDAVLDKPLHEIGDKALFTKELEVALLAKEADICVHSMKDVSSELPDGCVIAAMLPREDVRDVLVCGARISTCKALSELPEGCRIGTGSLRRAAQLRSIAPLVEPKSIRGNVDTRLKKAFGEEYDGVVLAAAGVKRMGEQEKISAYVPVGQMVPAAGQGAIGVEARSDDEEVLRLVGAINDSKTFECVEAERKVLAALGGSCKVPLGVYIRCEDGAYVANAVVASVDGSQVVRVDSATSTQGAAKLADEVVARLESGGALQVLAQAVAEGGE